MKEGNSKQFSASGGIGTISSRLTLEGPIVPDKVSFLLAGRRTYADLFLLFSKKEALRKTRLNFYDLNGKVNYRINDKNRIFLSGYSGKDTYANKEIAGMVFGNRTFTLRWNHIFNNNLFSNFTLVNSHYFYDLGTPEGSAEYFNWNSILDDYGFKGDFTWYPSPEHTVRFGASGIIHVIKPGVVSAVSTGGINQSMELTHNHSLENGLYLSGESTLGDNLSIRYGVRYSIFSNVGPTTVFHYDDDYNLVDSTYYEQGDFFNFYHGLEPRIAANYMLSEQHSVKASYSRTRQYLQLASNSTAGTPLEIWFPASPNIAGKGLFGWRGSDRYGTWWRTGYLTGSSALMVRQNDGINWVVMTNTSTYKQSRIHRYVSSMMFGTINAVQQWPVFDLFTMDDNHPGPITDIPATNPKL